MKKNRNLYFPLIAVFSTLMLAGCSRTATEQSASAQTAQPRATATQNANSNRASNTNANSNRATNVNAAKALREPDVIYVPTPPQSRSLSGRAETNLRRCRMILQTEFTIRHRANSIFIRSQSIVGSLITDRM